MFAVIALGGKQYRVSKGEYLTVDRVSTPEGETFEVPVVFAQDGDRSILDADGLSKVTVTARVDEHLLGPKVRVFRYTPKKDSKKMRGHRSRLSKVTIADIAISSRKR
jgi:large subunit ribosomal protein L21